MIPKFLTAGFLLLAVLMNGCEGTDPLENTCEAIDVYVNYQSTQTTEKIDGTHHEVHVERKNRTFSATLYRFCDSHRTVDFSIPIQKLMGCPIRPGIENQLFKRRNEADWFMVRLNDLREDNFSPFIIGNVIKASDEELEKTGCGISTFILASHLHERPNFESPVDEDFTEVDIVPINSEKRRETVRLRPNITELAPGVMVEHELIPLDADSTLKARNVFVMASWFHPRPNESALAVIKRLDKQQYITLFFERPLLTNTNIFPGHVNATLMNSSPDRFRNEIVTVQLHPGWIGELGPLGSNQTMIQNAGTASMSKRDVTVMPKYRSLAEGQGVHAKVNMIYMEQIITIYYRD